MDSKVICALESASVAPKEKVGVVSSEANIFCCLLSPNQVMTDQHHECFLLQEHFGHNKVYTIDCTTGIWWMLNSIGICYYWSKNYQGFGVKNSPTAVGIFLFLKFS